MSKIEYPPVPPVRDWPCYWFARLEQAVADGEFEIAAEAQRQLERLGVTVKYRSRLKARQEVASE